MCPTRTHGVCRRGPLSCFYFVCGKALAPAADERFAGGAAPPQRTSPVPGCPRSHPVGGVSAPAARRHARRVAHLAGGGGWTCREPSDARTGCPSVGLAAKKKSVHAAERDTERVIALRAAFIEAVQHEDFTCFKFVDEMRIKHLGRVPPSRTVAAMPGPKAGSVPRKPRPCTADQT